MKDIQQLFQEFIWECQFSRKLRPKTIKCYTSVFLMFSRLMSDVQIADISTATITQFFKLVDERNRMVGKGRIKQGVKKSTIASYWHKLSSFFEWLERNKHIQRNPLKQMKCPTPQYEEKQFLTRNEVEKIFTAIYQHHNNDLLILKRNVALFTILLFCGLRKGELLSLQIRDVDMEGKVVTVRSEYSKSGTGRKVPLNVQVSTVLRDYLRERKKYTSQYLFVSSKGDRQLSYEGLNHLVMRLNIASNIRFHVHQFRHTFAINFLKQSNNIFKLKELLGHKDISMTAVYLRCLPLDEMRGDVERLSIDSLL